MKAQKVGKTRRYQTEIDQRQGRIGRQVKRWPAVGDQRDGDEGQAGYAQRKAGKAAGWNIDHANQQAADNIGQGCQKTGQLGREVGTPEPGNGVKPDNGQNAQETQKDAQRLGRCKLVIVGEYVAADQRQERPCPHEQGGDAGIDEQFGPGDEEKGDNNVESGHQQQQEPGPGRSRKYKAAPYRVGQEDQETDGDADGRQPVGAGFGHRHLDCDK